MIMRMTISFGSRNRKDGLLRLGAALTVTGYEYPTLRPFEATKEQCKDTRQLHVPRAFCPSFPATPVAQDGPPLRGGAVVPGGTRSEPVEGPPPCGRDPPQPPQGQRWLALAPGA